MPSTTNAFVPMESLTLAELVVEMAGGKYQEYWYRFANKLVGCSTVLDVGGGTGYGAEILREVASSVRAIDPLPTGPGVEKGTIADVADIYDWITCIDVIEHVLDDKDLLRQMILHSRVGVFFTTPNWNRHHCTNKYHCREYTPYELGQLIAGPWPVPLTGEVYASEPGLEIWRVEQLRADDTFSNFGVVLRYRNG